MVIVPHQDDEILLTGGIIKKAVMENIEVTLVMATNGDCGCNDYSVGRVRLEETLEGMEYLGLSCENVIFLGYADTGMLKDESFLWKLYQQENEEEMVESHCSTITYGLEEKLDYHTSMYKTPAVYCRKNFYNDLKDVILRIRPENIFTTSEYDIHGDHSGLYLFVRDVLEELKVKYSYETRLFCGMVHSAEGDESWPLKCHNIEAFTCPKDFDKTTGLQWENRISFLVPESMDVEDREKNSKHQALSKHKTALKPDAVDYLYSFVKKEEIFWEMEKQPIYPVEDWTITETSFEIKNNYRNETTFALSNGYLGTRGTFFGNFDFGIDIGLEGNFINGFYESEEVHYGEWNFGFPTKSQSLLNLPNAKIIQLYIDGEMFDIRKGSVWDYKRVLHMKEGQVTRSLIWTSEKGKEVRIQTSQLVSFSHKNRMVIEYKVTPLNFSGEIRLVSRIEEEVENHTRKTNPLVDYGPFGKRIFEDLAEVSEKGLYYQGHTKNSGLSVACGCTHKIMGSKVKIEADKDKSSITYKLEGEEGREIKLEKFIAYTSDLDMGKDKMFLFLKNELQKALDTGYDQELLKQKEYMGEFWKTADVTIEGDKKVQQGIRFNLFHIMQAAGRDGRTGMGAKGLSGEGYEGHYFWDTEMYIIPVFIYSNPDIARNLLDYRYSTLNEARDRARVLGHEKGALYPWRTINGTEASTYFPLGTAQYHINADIAYAFSLYVKVTKDMDYLKEKAAEVLCETARVWADVGCFAESKGDRYCICAVTGPDEYNAIVDNNFYTNLMARENIRDAVKALDYLKKEDIQAYNKLKEKIGLEEEEITVWEKIVEHMYFPYDEKRQIYPLDDGFMQRKPWDGSKIPKEKRHLLYENYHPLFIFRQRMSKQADAILGMYLHSNLFTKEELKRNYEFYQEVTLHHSSLSTCIFGIVACQIGDYETAYHYFEQSARMDLDDSHNNFYAGIHAANMAGTWQAIVNGFAGMRSNKGVLEFHPFVPKQWKGYQFCIKYQNAVLEVSLSHKEQKFTLVEGNNIEFFAGEKKITLSKEGDYWNEEV